MSSFAALATAAAIAGARVGDRLAIQRVSAPKLEVDGVVRLASLRTVEPVWADDNPNRPPARATAPDGRLGLLPCTAYDVFHNRRAQQCSVPRPGEICALTLESCTCSQSPRDPVIPALLR